MSNNKLQTIALDLNPNTLGHSAMTRKKHPQSSQINHYQENQWHILHTLTSCKVMVAWAPVS